MALHGDLKDFELHDIFQFIQMGGKKGALHLECEQGEGLIYFENEKIMHAEVGEDVGTDAINIVLKWDKGKFSFNPGESTEKRTIDMPIQNVVLEAARQIDEWKKMEDVIPSTSVVIDFVEEPDVGNIELQPHEWKVMSFIDGDKSIKDIANQLDMETFEVGKIVYGLVKSGLIKVLEEKKEEENNDKEEIENEDEEEPKRRGFFRR